MGLFDFIGKLFSTQTDSIPEILKAPQLGASQSRQSQSDFAEALKRAMSGEGPSVADAAFKKNLGDITAQTNALAASTKGRNSPALAQRQAMNANAAATQNANQLGGLGRAGEALTAQGQLGQFLNGLGQQDLAGNEANLRSQLITSGLNTGIAQGNTQSINQMTGAVLGGLAQLGSSALGGGSKAASAGAAAFRGGRVPGDEVTPGDSESNDVVDAKLSPGEIVIPKTAAKTPAKAKSFVDHLMHAETKDDLHYGHLVAMHKRIEQLESKLGKKHGK